MATGTGAEQQPPIDVDLIADLACPWCYIGLVRLDRARAMRPDWPVRLRWWPFLLNPTLPPEGMDRSAYLRAKFGGDEAARQVYRRIVESAQDDGIAFAFERMKRTPNTILAQRLILLAEQQGRGEDLIRVLFRALFEQGRDIGHLETLLELAESGRPRAGAGRVPSCARRSRRRRSWRRTSGPSAWACAACRCSWSTASRRSPAPSRRRCWPGCSTSPPPPGGRPPPSDRCRRVPR